MKFFATVTGRPLQRRDFGVPGDEDAVFETSEASDLRGALLKSPRAQPSAQGSIV